MSTSRARECDLTEAGHVALGDLRPVRLREIAGDLREHGKRGFFAEVEPAHLAALLERSAEEWSRLTPGERDLICLLAGVEVSA